MRQLPALVTTLLLSAAQPVAIIMAVTTAPLIGDQATAQAQSVETAAKVAQSITVRIEGATQGSGVLVKRDDKRYTVLTAWHVVSGQRTGEELDVFTADGQRHQLEQGSIKRLGEVDMAVLSFSSRNSYEVAPFGDVKSVSSGSSVYVSGFPLPTSAVPSRVWRFLKGDVIANATVSIPNGYQLLYSNPTLPGMSGGAVLNAQGRLIGIHGQAETDSKMSEQEGVAVKTGTNQAVPITYYSQYSTGAAVVAPSTQATTADDYLAQAKALLEEKGREQEVIRLASQALATKRIADAYFYRAYAKNDLGDWQGAIADYSQAIAINPQIVDAYSNRGASKSELGDNQGAIADFNQAIALDPRNAIAYNNRGTVKSSLGDSQGAIADYSQAIAFDPKNAIAYNNRGAAKGSLGDEQGAIADFSQAIANNAQYANAYYNRGVARFDLGDKQGAIADYNQAITINPQGADVYHNRGLAKSDLGDKQGAIADYNQAITINPQGAGVYANRGNTMYDLGDEKGACSDYKASVSLGHQSTTQWLQSDGGAWCRNMP